MKKINKNRIELLFEICSEFPKGKGAEVGTFKGEFSRDIIRRWFGTLYMIDVWRGLGDEYEDASNHKYFSEGVYGIFVNIFSPIIYILLTFNPKGLRHNYRKFPSLFFCIVLEIF